MREREDLVGIISQFKTPGQVNKAKQNKQQQQRKGIISSFSLPSLHRVFRLKMYYVVLIFPFESLSPSYDESLCLCLRPKDFLMMQKYWPLIKHSILFILSLLLLYFVLDFILISIQRENYTPCQCKPGVGHKSELFG